MPTICLAEMSDADVRAYVIADNRLAENAGWDDRLLALELGALNDLDIDYDLTLTGFEMPEIDVILLDVENGGSDDAENPADYVPEVASIAPVTQENALFRAELQVSPENAPR